MATEVDPDTADVAGRLVTRQVLVLNGDSGYDRRLWFCDVCGWQAWGRLGCRARCRNCGGSDDLAVPREPDEEEVAEFRREAARLRREDYRQRASA